MKSIETRRRIEAAPAVVWRVLTDAKALADGATGIVRLEGRIGAGARLRLWSEVAPGRAFALTVTAFEPPARMVWRSGMPFGLFRGVRSFVLTPEGHGTDFHMKEDFSGPLLPLIWPAMPDLRPSFEQFAAGVAAIAENRS